MPTFQQPIVALPGMIIFVHLFDFHSVRSCFISFRMTFCEISCLVDHGTPFDGGSGIGARSQPLLLIVLSILCSRKRCIHFAH
jgi:hypothetical protein